VRSSEEESAVLVSLAEAEKLLGVPFQEILNVYGVQELTRVFADGSVEESLRVPVSLLPPDPCREPSRPRRRVSRSPGA
jgi:hypothetical protein